MTKASRRDFEYGLSAEAFNEICGADPEALRRLRLGISVLEIVAIRCGLQCLTVIFFSPCRIFLDAELRCQRTIQG
ncbi:hypothetical protein RA280_22965 [Cupriavidus sp. CV2]|uniref:hypothetical protein n=1 Tax=Cupriavidus ulmosensis TaxID=3065913 RepID=UPI00296AA90B|nr:hypothetical protein [Cupriavidus sp. CV2]MDW3684556.1 hypothetical protein [Cupriavidus sp. CV2]